MTLNFKAYVDGGANNYKKGFGYGSFKIYYEDIEIFDYRFELKTAKTSNEAEILSMIKLLTFINKYANKDSNWTIYADSQLVVRSLNNKVNIHAENLKPLFKIAKDLLIDRIKIIWVSREKIVKELGH